MSPDLTGTVTDLNIYDPINNGGQVAFWAKTSTSQEAVVRANPALRPVLVLPGIGGSLPVGGVGPLAPGYRQWLLNRGAEPDTLRLDETTKTYDDLIETLKRSGYVEGVNLFSAAYDWRLAPGPTDGVIDGSINYSASDITDDTYEYSVDQLGFWIKRAIEGWRTQFPDGAAPALESIDVIAHSTGGLVTRAYIQSTAYQNEESFSFTDSNGDTIAAPLPRVNNFTMIGVPNRGASLAWNPLNNDFAGYIGAEIIRGITAAARNKVLINGEQILLSGGTTGAITDATDPLTFIEEYVPTIRTLLATYPFIDDLADTTDTLKTAEEFNPALSNNFLLDLNNGFDSTTTTPGDPTSFVDPLPSGNLGVEQLNVIYGTNAPRIFFDNTRQVSTRDAVRERSGFFDPRLVLRVEASFPFLEFGTSFTNDYGIVVSPTQNRAGDGTVPVGSAERIFLSSPKPNINLVGFIDRSDPDLVPPVLDRQPTDRQTNDKVDHTDLVSNVDVQKFILQTLGVTLDESNISTNLRGSGLPPSISALVGESPGFFLSAGLAIDPVEGFLVDNLGRRLGYSQATGPLTEIPSSFWVGEEEGFGWSTEPLQGPFELQLTGLGETYSVSLLIQTPDGVGGIETSSLSTLI